MRSILLPVLLAACERPLGEDDRLVREGAIEVAALAVRLAPPPPPPPPPLPQIVPAPEEIVAFVRSHATEPAPWRVTVRELPRGGHRVLGRAASVRFIAKLLQPIYTDGDCGCFVDPSIGIRIQRGAATLDLVVNAAHLFLTPEGHDGRFVVLHDTASLEELYQ